MPIYIQLGKFTQKGIENIKDSPKRVEDAKTCALASRDTELKEFYYTMGQYDYVAIIEQPNDKAMTASIIARGMLGNVRTETLKATTVDEMKEILKELT
jgi:uncharacterized protein with GYD domain